MSRRALAWQARLVNAYGPRQSVALEPVERLVQVAEEDAVLTR